MHALRYDRYGGPEVMEWRTLPEPIPADGEVSVRVKAASINPVDIKVRQGEMKIMTGRRMPKGMGSDVAGIVERVGPGVSELKAGDAVFGYIGFSSANSFGELAIAKADLLVKKPEGITFEEASCLPQAGVAALQALKDKAHLRTGQHVLVVGCTGGVGQFVVMVAKALGAQVTGICRAEQTDSAAKLGCDRIIHSTDEAKHHAPNGYDVIFDTPGALRTAQAMAMLSDKGVFLDLNPKPANLLGAFLLNPFRNRKHRPLITAVRRADLLALADLATRGALRPLIGRVAPMHSAVQLLTAMELGERSVGKTVLVNV